MQPRQEQVILPLALAHLQQARLVLLSLRHLQLLPLHLLHGTPITDVSFLSTACVSSNILIISSEERMPGEFPSDGGENPYRATNLDPRVDGGKPRPPTTQASSGIPSHTRDSTLGSSTSGVASGLGTSHNERSVPSAAHEHSGPAPSTLTSTADPAARAAQYATSANTRVPDTTSTTTTQSQHTGEQQGFMGRALDAVGLGNAANATAGYLGYGAVAHGTSESTEPRDTSAIATHPGMVAQESGPPRHYRRESIPTTAYPSTDAARPIAAPVGGTLDARRSIDRGVGGSNTGISNERGIGGTPATTQGVTTGSGFGLGSQNSGVPRQEYSESSRVRDNISTSGTHDSHTGRNVAAGGAAAAATGAGIHGLQHQGRSDDLRSSAAEDARRDDTLSGGHSYTIGSGGPAPMDAISSRDPNSRSAGLQGTGLGSSTSASRPMDAVAAAPGRYDGQDYSSNSRTGPSAIGGSGEQSLRRDDHSHSGRDAALGASAAAAAIYATGDRGHHGTIHDAITVGTPTTTDASTRGTSTGQSTIDSRHYDVHGAHDSSSYGTSTGYGTAGTTGITGTHGTHGTTGTTGLTSHGTSAGYGTTGLSTGGASTTGPSSYGTSTGYGTAPTHDTTTLGDRNLRQEGDHTGRNVGLGAAAGTAAGGAAYAAHDRHNEKEIEKQRSHAEKEERKHHKEVEKEEKRQQKEMDKEEKEHAAAAEKREHARLAAEEEDRKRRERETAAGVAPLTQTGMVSHDPHAHEKEKKPSIFKRIFKRRQNKDTGEEEEYSSDDEEDKARHYAAGGSSVPVHHSDDKGRNVLGHGRDKEAYREQPAWRGPVTDVAAENSMNTPGRPHPAAEERLGYQPGSTSAGYSPSGREGGAAAISGATAGGVSSGYGASDQRTGHLGSGTTGLTSGNDSRPHDTYTGLPYDPSKDPSTAARLSEHEQGGLTGRSGTTGSGHILGSEPLGEITDHRR